MNTPTPAQPLGEAVRMIEGCRVFVTSREKIKHPEGTDLFDESLRVIKQTAAILADEVERWKSCNKQNAGELDDIRSLTRPLFKNVDPMPGDCMIGVNRSVTVYGYVRDVVKQLEIAHQHGQHFAGLESALAKSNQSRAEYAGEIGVLQVELLGMKARAEAAEARCAELERERDTYCAQNRTLRDGVAPMLSRSEQAEELLSIVIGDSGSRAYHGDELHDRIAAFLAARG